MIHTLDGPHRGHFSHEVEPALTIDPGDTVMDSGWGLEPWEGGAYQPRREVGRDDHGHLVTLWLPVEVEGALFPWGDGHAAQGDGDVAGTAIECPMERAELTSRWRSARS